MKKTSTLIAILFAAVIGCGTSTLEPLPSDDLSDSAVAPAESTGIVTIQIESDSGLKSFEVPDVAMGTTVEQLMRSIDQVTVEITGSGSSAFIDSLDGQSTSSDLGWTYRIDGKYAPVGIGSTKLTPPTTIEWKFGDWE